MGLHWCRGPPTYKKGWELKQIWKSIDLRTFEHLPARFRVSADEEAVVGVSGRDAGDADARLSKDVVDRQSHDVLWDKVFRKLWHTSTS